MKKLFILLLSFGILQLRPAVFAASPTSSAASAVCTGIGLNDNGSTTCDETSGGGKGVNGVISTAVNILSSIVGIAAVVMVIVGGVKYITSGGDSNKVGAAKTTIMYALVGVLIAVMSQVLVHYVINKATAPEPVFVPGTPTNLDPSSYPPGTRP
jgi:hypothetical protein